jgi:phenylacetate-CoA ligase
MFCEYLALVRYLCYVAVMKVQSAKAVETNIDSKGRSKTSPFLGFTNTLPTQLKLNDANDWTRIQNSIVLKRFKNAAHNVPAYGKFLERMGLDYTKITGAKDIKKIPSISKANYLRVHPWDKLCTAGTLANQSLVLTATSGSTGEPFYIPRTDDIHESSNIYHRLFVERSNLDPKKPTLVVVCFGVGVWIGGLLTYEAFSRVSRQGHPLTIITPGVNKREIFEALTRIAPSYEQLILCGYPPFIKDIIDDGPQHGVNWKRWNMRIVCAAEAFSEHFRDYIMKKTGMKNPYRSMMNIYGSAELGTMATETPLTILLRRLALKNEGFYKHVFSEAHRLPTLTQFIPNYVAFEADENGRVYCTGGEALPFIRYDIGDTGGVFSFNDLERMCLDMGINLTTEIKRAGIEDTITQLPFVYLYERSDLSTKLYGAIIYPEHVKIALQRIELETKITGRFTMSTEHDTAHNEYLEVNVELQAKQEESPELKEMLVASIMESLARNSDEYRYLEGTIHDKIIPNIIFWPHEHPKYFHPGIKQRWVIK